MIQPELHEFVATQLLFRGSISVMIAEIAQSIMGRERPLHEDDQEYYAFCDYLFDQVALKIDACLEDFIKGL
jgi:hypothetical protein